MIPADDPPPSPPTRGEDVPGSQAAHSGDAAVDAGLESTSTYAPPAGVGALIAGRYVLLERIGEGGMGEVWVARQSEPIKRKVALKLIKKGMDSQSVLARFEAERQALAVMDHPNIARILDGGVTGAGAPYFVMELVSGLPLARFCDQTRLSIPDRLRLFATICQAVQHAHLKGIVHRDLKPSNILVTLVDGKPAPKIVDFGVAKALSGKLTEESISTQFGAVIGTLEYMAPEQAGLTAQDVDTRADVYSLGVILYELLTGLRPFDSERLRKAALDEVVRILREEDPPSLASRLSTADSAPSAAAVRQLEPRQLLATLKGELNWIVARCLEKDRNRRYETASGLARDVERYLADEPIEARPASPGYRLRKLYRRNRVPVLAGGLVLLALGGGIVGTTWGLVRTERQRRIAQDKEQEADLARKEAENRARAEEKAKVRAQAETKRAEQEKARAAAKAEEVRHALYAARQQVAMNAWRENRADVLAEVLERQKLAAGERDLRGFEWGYLDRLARAPGRRWRQGGPMVNGVALSPDDRTALTVGFDGKATAWDVATGRPLWDTGAAFRWSVNAAAISPDGKTVALAGHLGQLQLWGIDGKPRAKLEGHQAQVFGVAFSPDGKLLASASADMSVRLWDVTTGKAAGVLSPAFKRKENRPGPQALPQTNPLESVGHTNMVWQAAWAPDGRRLASCSTDGSIKIWALPERRLLRTLMGHEGLVVAVAWSPDGRLVAGVSRALVGAGGGEVKIWNPDTGRAEATFRPPSGGLHAVSFTPDGLYVVTAGQDRSVRVWRKDGRLVTEQRGFRGDVIGLAVGGRGRWAVAGTRAGEVVALELDAAPGKQATATSGPTRLAFAGDGRLAAFRHGEVSWYDPETLAETGTWPAAAMAEAKVGDKIFSDVVAFTMRRNGAAAHSGHEFIGPGTVVWRDAAGKVRHLLAGHAAPISALAFLPGDRLASADQDGAIRVWDGSTGTATANLRPWDGPIRFLAVTADGRLWAGGAPWAPGSQPGQFKRPTSKEGRLARIEEGRVAWEAKTPSVSSAADVSPDGRLLVVASDDGALLWLESGTGKEVRRRASSARGAMVSLRFAPNESRIAAGGADGVVRLLDADSGEELLVLEGPAAPAASLAFSPDGRRLAAAAATVLQGGAIVVWDGRPAGDWPALPAPDAAWHKARLAVAGGGAVHFGVPAKDAFAMRYHLNRLAALEPNDIQWPRRLLALDQDAGDYGAAAARLDDIVRRWPGDAPMWYDLGNARRELGDVAGAEAAFRKCIALDPRMAQAQCNLGLLLGREGRFADAIEFLSRGHELGLALQKAGKPWGYPSAAWLARHKRFGDLAARYGARQDFAEVPTADRRDLVEVLTQTRRPLAAVRLADPKSEASPGPVVVGAALRCAEGIGDAAALAAADRSAWRAKALAWLRLDYEGFRSAGPIQRARQVAGMRSHPLLQIARGDRVAAWPAAERAAWQQFWADVDAAVKGP